jgi:hypothetical protein
MTIVVITVAKMPYLHAVVVTPAAVDLPAVAGNTPVAVFFIVMCSNFVAEVLAAFWGSGVPADFPTVDGVPAGTPAVACINLFYIYEVAFGYAKSI